jgi:plasmid stability protein
MTTIGLLCCRFDSTSGGGCITALHIRLLDQEVVRQLKRRAAENNRSLEGEIRHILEQATLDRMPEMRRAFLTLTKGLRKHSVGRPQTPSQILVREDRDAGHRAR